MRPDAVLERPLSSPWLSLVTVLATCACESTPEEAPAEAVRTPTPAAPAQMAPAQPACAMSDADRAWIERALEAWRFTSREISGIGRVPRFRAIFFDASCVLTSEDALTSPTAEGVTWSAAPHAGQIPMPDGREIPSGVTSFCSGDKQTTWFAMSTPSVWSAGGVGEGPDLEQTMVAVMLHEATHVAQIKTYGPRLGALIDRYRLPDSFGDDAVQERFGSNHEFAASVGREIQLFTRAAAAGDDTEAKLLADDARELMRERKERWFVGDDAYLAEAEDIWLTYEGSAQWVAYQWQVHPRGAAAAPADIEKRLTRDSHWSQAEGFALVFALDRIAGPDWKRHAFGDGAQTVIEMMDTALAAD